MKKQTLKLNIESDEQFYVIGISSHENDYRISWAINQSLGFSLVKIDDFSTVSKKTGASLVFSVYQYEDEDNYITYKLYSNTSLEGFLVEKLKNFDFILTVKGEVSESDVQQLNSRLKAIEIVNVTIIPDQTITSKLGYLTEE